MVKYGFILSLFLLGAVATPVRADDTAETHVSEQKGVRLIHAWTRATTDKEALVFLEIENTSETDVVLQGGKTEIAGSVDLVGFQLIGAEPNYVPLGAMPVSAGLKIVLAPKPKAMALRLDELTKPLKIGETFEMEIIFDAGPIKTQVAVEKEDAKQHSHAGHEH